MLLHQPLSFHLRASSRRRSYLSSSIETSSFIMIRVFITFTLSLFWLTGRSLGSKVIQVPSALLGSPNITEILKCNHSISAYNTILWYQQSIADTNLKLIGYVFYKNPTVEDQFKEHVEIRGDGEKEASLHLLSLRAPEDSAVYYCAASQHRMSQTDEVQQTPTAIIKRPEENVQLNCSHTIPNYNIILWYQQSAQNTALKLIGYVLLTNPTVEDSFKERFTMGGDAATGKMAYLHIPKLRGTEDSAVYFCAASYAPCFTIPSLLYKNPL
ncbi:unnamed protein product [Coregonus sp. 'balchen']|nr:unnamed protein product [Coregonus sp. 'balchen']